VVQKINVLLNEAKQSQSDFGVAHLHELNLRVTNLRMREA
jgi:hypothetical protein